MRENWFKKLTGFDEQDYETTKEYLEVKDNYLISKVNNTRHLIGEFEVLSLEDLRNRCRSEISSSTTLSTKTIVHGDVSDLHLDIKNNGTLFQVASQFNMLEMVHPYITKYDGVTRYEFDKTQGPACAISAGAATIYRNYFAPDIDGLKDVKMYLQDTLQTTESFWNMKNGYALCTDEGLKLISDFEQQDEIRKRISYGIHWDTQVSNSTNIVSQIFCSALPVAYGIYSQHWESFARLVLEAAYEATLLTAILNKSNIVYLTLLGGGVFGNDTQWINDAIDYAFEKTKHYGLDIRIVYLKR